MLGAIARVWFGVWLGCFAAAAAQLPPDVMADKHLLQAKMLSEEKDHRGALEVMDRVLALQKEHGLTLPEAFSFHYAQTALNAGAVQAAIDSANQYLSEAGRAGKHYREALELLVKAERRLQEPALDRVGSTPVKPDLEPQSQTVPPSSTQAQKTTAAQPVVDCRQWSTDEYFKTATVDSVTTCLEAGADPNAWTKWKLTPLYYAAASNENPAVIEALLKAGADPNARTKWKSTPLHYAAASNENPAVIQTLLKAGADPKARDEDKNTPLYDAARYNRNPGIIEALLKGGADASADLKWTPLHEAVVINENPGVIEALLRGGADPRARDNWKYTPLHWAARHNPNPAVIEVLLKAGADVKARGKDKNTPLHNAAKFNENPAVIKALLEAGADPKARNSWKNTPLHMAARGNQNLAVIEALLKAGADPKARGADKRTPLHTAAEYNENPAVIEALLAAGSDLEARDFWKATPLARAEYKNPAVAEILRKATADRDSQQAALRSRQKSKSSRGDGSSGLAALVAGLAGGAIASASGLDAATATEIGATIGGSVLAGEAVGSSGTGASLDAPSGNTGAASGGGPCQVPGYPNPPGGVSNLGFSWCPASVSLQVRSFALQAAGAECAIATGSSSTPEQIEARRREIRAACDRLAALGQGNCQCPPGLK